MAKKVCKDCKVFYDDKECPMCKSNKVASGWQGRIFVLDASKSAVAKNIGIEKDGEYAIKVR